MPNRPKRSVQSVANAARAVVALGCSAGGLEALLAFFAQVPPGSDLAFVVVQHLDPDRPSTLCELLQRATPLRVLEAIDGMAVSPGCVHVIPRGKDLSIEGGVLHLIEPDVHRGLRLSVDRFLRSLAADQGERAVAVILSGMGSDGSLGLRAVKACGGVALAQDPTTATEDSMPRSAIATGVVDIVAPPGELPARVDASLRGARAEHPEAQPNPDATVGDVDSDAAALAKIVLLLRGRCGNDFALYKTGTVQRRVERRIALHQFSGMTAYLQHVHANPHELDLLFKELLIGVTSFFRDAEAWEYLRRELIPQLLARHPTGHAFRAWVPACSSGEEAYTLAMVFRDAVADTQPGPRYTLQIYATDLDLDAVARARKGVYPLHIARDVGAERIARFFVEEGDGYRVAKEVRDMLIFAQQNVTTDPPFTKLDFLTCRNLLIYFGAELQDRLLPLFHYALNKDGLLMLGSAETVGHSEGLFAPAHARHHFYRRLDETLPTARIAFPACPSASSPVAPMSLRTPPDNLGLLTDQLIQQSYAPAAVLVNADGDILYISGRTGKYLEPAAGRVNINIHAMAREGLASALAGVIRRSAAQADPILLRSIKVGTNGGTQHVDVTVQALTVPEPLRGRVLIVFRDVAPPAQLQLGPEARDASPEDVFRHELHEAREALRILREETQSSLEELKSANEELQSTNEELQSTNEELTTSKEEMQSMNEEMRTVNTELQSKVNDLTWERNDMANLLNSTEIATIFLDNQMQLRRFTAFATRLFKLIPGDIGRPLSDLVTELDYPALLDDAREVLRTLVFSEKEVGATDGRWSRVRLMPYRTQDNVIDGVVSTFVDISQTKVLEAKLRQLGGQG